MNRHLKQKSFALSCANSLSGPALAVLPALFAAGCGDKVNVKEAANDELREIVWEKDGLSTALDDNMSITHILVSRTTDRAFHQNASSAADRRPRYNVEFWGRYINADGRPDTSTSVTRHGVVKDLLSDNSGNLYVDSFEPGTVIDNPALATAAGEVQRDLYHWTVGTNNALIAKFDWVKIIEDNIVAGAVTTTTENLINLGDLFQIGNKEGASNKLLSDLSSGNAFFTFSGDYAASSNDAIYSVNKDYKTYSAAAACVNRPFDATTATNQTGATTAAMATATVNLGQNLVDPDGQINASDKIGTTGAQNLIVSWTVQYRLAGLNWQSGKVFYYRTKSAPVWQNRELPSVDASSTNPQPSGLELAIRECNSKSTTNSKWSLITRNPAASLAAPAVGYCDGLKKDTSDLNKFPLKGYNDTLAATPYDCTASFAGLSTIAADGNWQLVTTAMAHTDRIHSGSAAETLLDVDTTDIKEVDP